MSNEETGQVIQNQSNLLQSTVEPTAIKKQPQAALDFDEVPIGGKKFQFSEFPEQGQQIKPPKKAVKPKLSSRLNKKNQDQKPANDQAQKEITTITEEVKHDEKPIGVKSNNNFDQMPIGGGKKIQMSQFPQEGQPQPEPKKLKPKPKLSGRPAKKDNPPPPPPPTQQPSNSVVQPISNDQVPIGGGGKVGGFDQQPIGKPANNFMMSQFPQGDVKQPETQTNYPMGQKLKSKAPKLRLSGFEDLYNLLSENPQSDQFAQIDIGKLLKETNPACLEKILQCFQLWIQKNKKWGDDEAKMAIESGYINGKPNTKKLTVDITDMMYDKAPDCVQMSILIGLKGKVPKTLAGYLSILNQLLTIYGMKKLKYMKPYMKDMVTVLNRQKLVAVKTEGMNLLKQCYKWLSKDVMDPMLKDLKENLKKQLDSFWQTYDKTIVMSAPKDIPEENGGKAKKKIDAYQLSEAADIFKKYNQKFTDTVLKTQKWNQKVELMQEFVNAASVPKIANSDYRHFTELIRRLINHNNFNVVLWDLKILAVLAKGLRRPFAPVVKSQFSNVIGKFRDKKTQMIDETFHTLNQFSYCISLEDVIDDVKQGLTDKAPNMKVNLINWIGKFVEKRVQEKDQLPDKTRDALKSLFPSFEKLLADGVADVRDTMAKNIGKMKILLGDDFFSQVDKKMSKVQASKIEDIKKQLPARKISRQKQEKKTPTKSDNKASKTNENTSFVGNKGKADINQEMSILLPKLTHSDWQKRKESAEAIMSLISTQQKLQMSCLNDFLGVLKSRIADPNKQLVKTFVNLTGMVFELMSEKDVKANAKSFICALAQGLSDKVQANRKEISLTLNKMGQIYGREHLVTILGSFLDNDKDSRIQIIKVILDNQDYILKADTRDYPKGIIKCLCDRNKQIRKEAEKLFEKIQEKTGLEVFKNLARNQRPAIAKDLNALFSKYEGGTIANNSSMISKGVSPPKKAPPISHKKTNQRSLGKSKVAQSSFDRDLESQQQHLYATMNNMGSNILKQPRSFVQGNQQFAPLKILASQRVARQQKDERYPWMCDNLLESQQDELVQSINLLFKQEVSKRMLSLDHRKVIDAASHLIKLCKDIAHQNQIRQIYDLLFKWTFIRLWGGNPAVHSILQVLPPVMSILEKKKLAMNDGQVDIVVAILREYFITGYMNEYKVSESLYTITKCLIALSSGDRLLKKFLRQFAIQLPSIHRHIRKQATAFYRQGLSKLIKSQLMEYIGNGSTLQEASRIKQLKNDPQFVDILYKRLHENVLDSLGFRQAHQNSSHVSGSTEQQSKPYRQVEPVNRPSKTPPQRLQRRKQEQNPQTRSQLMSREDARQSKVITNRSQEKLQDDEEQLDISMYPMPHSASPLGKNLLKLIPPNDATVSFFSSLFVESGQKISNQLTTHAKVIFGHILKSVILMLDNRNQYLPDKIFNQISLLQQSIKCKFIILNIGQLLYHGTKFALTQLVFQDENKSLIVQDLQARGLDFKAEQFIKVINGVMLRILENACPQETVNILLRLLNYNSSQQYVSQKTVSLIIKCLSRVTNNYSQDINDTRTKQFILRMIEYFNLINLDFPLQQFNPPPQQRLRPEQNIIKCMKTIINELVKHYGEEIWVHYENIIKQSRYNDQFFTRYLQFLGVPYPENIESFNQEDQALKQINQLLSKTKTFDRGIDELKKYLAENNGFNPVQYFTSRGYDQKFIAMVMNSLQRQRPKRTPTKRELREQKSQNSRKSVQAPSSQTNIQQRIQKLKRRFDQIQPNQQNQQKNNRPQIPTPNSAATRTQPHQQQREQDRALQIKRRIDEMKNRMARNN